MKYGERFDVSPKPRTVKLVSAFVKDTNKSVESVSDKIHEQLKNLFLLAPYSRTLTADVVLFEVIWTAQANSTVTQDVCSQATIILQAWRVQLSSGT